MADTPAMRRLAAFAVLLLAFVVPAGAAPYQLAPYKDELFAYPRILEEADGGAYLEVEYSRPRDLYARDTERGLKVKPEYVDLSPVMEDLAVRIDGRTVKTYAVGKQSGAKAIVVFIHGMKTGRATGMDDWIHGGNFNRIKNLMARNDGLYLSPSFADFGAKGAAEMKGLVLHFALQSPGAPVVLACGSLGARICWRLMSDPAVGPLLAGLILFDPVMEKADAQTALRRVPPLPILVTGSREDIVVGWRGQRGLFQAIRKAAPAYPIRYVLFSAGTHGLSLRMTDWRTTLNWMFAAWRPG